MKTIVLYDTPESRTALYPFTLTRPVAQIRNGIFTVAERWQRFTGLPVVSLTEAYLQEKFPSQIAPVMIDATCWPDDTVVEQILTLEAGAALSDGKGLIAFAANEIPLFNQFPVWPKTTIEVAEQYRLKWSPQLVYDNQKWMLFDSRFPAWENSSSIHPSNYWFGNNLIRIAGSATVRACTINAEDGPVTIDDEALVMEGCHLRGPVYIGKNAVVKMGSNLYPGTNIGTGCTVGGEIKNSILLAYSNKAHEGYLGDSVIGDWCNLGAGTFVSNVKNNAGQVRVYHAGMQTEMNAGQKIGCLMGDFSRTAILTAINSGTTIGICCSLHQPISGAKNIPSFWWGNQRGYALPKAIEDAKRWMNFKNKQAPDNLTDMLTHIFEQSE